ncbi:MAG: ATP-binding cassette domain-containing protein [Paracoccaceae bacterium]
MLTVEDLAFSQGGFRLTADFSVASGSTTAIIGPSGGGKSTLLNCIAGFAQPDAGRVLWDGADITDMTPGSRPISLIFQDNNLFPHMSVFDNVAIGLRPNMRLTQDDKSMIQSALSRVALGPLSERKPGELSGGQQSRVALARVLVRDRPLLLLDEPFAALGPALRFEMLDLVAELVETIGATLLMVTHDPGDAKRIAAQAIFVDEGVVHPPVETTEIFANPPVALAAYLGR